MRLAVFGARQRRRGIGAHLARLAAGAGAEVVAVLGSTDASAAEAAEALKAAVGLRPRPYADLDRLLEQEALDAVIIATPAPTHAAFLHRAAQEGLHALCEKPVVWGGIAPATEARVIARRFAAEGLWLRAVCQWPYTLAVYEALCGPVGNPERFRMRLGPSEPGRAMLEDSLSHPLSLLAAVAPDPAARVHEARVDTVDGTTAAVAFGYAARGRVIECRVDLVHSPAPPRPAGYGFDGHWVDREVELPGYALNLCTPDRRIPLPDPTALLVRSFVDAVRGGRAPEPESALVPGVEHLAALVEAWPAPHPSPR